MLAVGAPVFREYPYEPGPLVEPGTRVAVVTDDPEEAHRSPAEVAVVAPPAAVCAALAECLPARGADAEIPTRRVPPPLAAPVAGEALRAGHVLQAIADHLPADAALVEEAPSSRPELHARIPARAPLGFAMPAAVGLRMARRDRPVAAVVGDGASLYAIQSLWSAAHYGAGALFVVLANGRYAITDRLAERAEGSSPSPGFEAVDVAAVASGLGCEARCVERHDDLVRILADVLPELAGRRDPLLVGVVVEPDPEFAP